jgi:hypothetical protein
VSAGLSVFEFVCEELGRQDCGRGGSRRRHGIQGTLENYVGLLPPKKKQTKKKPKKLLCGRFEHPQVVGWEKS